LLSLIFVFFEACCSKQLPDNLIPRIVLFNAPSRSQPKISPDGKYLSYLAPSKKLIHVWVRDIHQNNDKDIIQNVTCGISWYFWAYDNEHIIYGADINDDGYHELYGVNIKTGDIKQYIQFAKPGFSSIGISPRDPNRILMAFRWSKDHLLNLYSINIKTGQLRLVESNSHDFIKWIYNEDLEPMGAVSKTSNGGADLWVKTTPQSEWKKIVSWGFEESFYSGPIRFSKNNLFLYLGDTRFSDTSQLVSLNLRTMEIKRIGGNPNYDFGNVSFHPSSLEVQAISYISNKRKWIIFDKQFEKDIKFLSSNNEEFFIVDRSFDDSTWIVEFEDDDGPKSFYIYDRKNLSKSFLFYHRPELTNYSLAPTKSISILSRDGIKLEGYLTLPLDTKVVPPVVLYVHGGPWSRDYWGFDPTVQWLANRGYACLQVNFRGSTGYGKRFLNAANKERGRKMQNDLEDAVKWAIKRKIVDQRAIGILGFSYGGYAALIGATKTPELFRCAIAWAAPTDLVEDVKHMASLWPQYSQVYYRTIGHPQYDRKLLEEHSPLFLVNKNTSPVLLGHGAKDRVVNPSHARSFVEFLEKLGIIHEFLLFPKVGHYFDSATDRIKFFAAAEKFLADHLGGEYEWSKYEAIRNWSYHVWKRL